MGPYLIMELDQSHVIVETDSQVLVELWKSRNKHRSEILTIMADIQELTLNLTSLSLVFVRHPANLGAHLRASPSTAHNVWFSPAPDFLLQCLQSDCDPND